MTKIAKTAPHRCAALFLSVKVLLKSILGRVGGQIFLDHQGYLENDSVVKVAQIQAGQLANLLQTVDQRVAMDEQPAARLGDIQVVFKEALDGEQRLGLPQGVEAGLRLSGR